MSVEIEFGKIYDDSNRASRMAELNNRYDALPEQMRAIAAIKVTPFPKG